MNSKEIQSLTKKLAANPNFLREVEEETMRDLLLDYTAGLLDPSVEQEVRELITSDPVATAFWKNINEIDARLRSPEGQQWTEEAGERILSNVLSEKPNIADQAAAIEHRQSLEILIPAATSGGLLKMTTAWIKERFTLFADLPQFEIGKAGDAVFCGDSPSGEQNQRVLNLSTWYGEVELMEKLPWAAHRVVLQKVPIKNKPGMVRYRALIEKRRGAASGAGTLRIALQAGERIDEIALQADAPSKTFQNAVLAGDAPVAFKPILE